MTGKREEKGRGAFLPVGRYDVASIVTGTIRLDGGAMYGVVPKVLWTKREDVDDDNRIAMTMRTLVARERGGDRVILVDTGAGNKWPAEEAERFAIAAPGDGMTEALAAVGVRPGEVTDVVATHFHFDHCGGMTVPGGTGKSDTALRFPHARIWVHEKHRDHAAHPTAKDRASFLARDLDGLDRSGRLRLVTGDDPPSSIPEVRWVLSHGHTPYQLLPLFEGKDRSLLFAGDMIPTAGHLRPAWVMAYDLFPVQTIEEKERTLSLCRDEGLLLAFPHDRFHGIASIHFPGGRPAAGEPSSGSAPGDCPAARPHR